MLRSTLGLAGLAVLPKENGFSERMLGKIARLSPEKEISEPAPANARLAGNFSLRQVMSFREVQNLVSFAGMNEASAERYMAANWERVAAYSDSLIADRSPSRGRLAKKINGMPFVGPSASVNDKIIVQWVALDMLMEMWLKRHTTSAIFNIYCAFGLNITNQESRFMVHPGGYNGASGKQLTPVSILAGKASDLNLLRPHLRKVDRFMYFEDDGGQAKRIVLNGGSGPYWNRGARNHIIENVHLAAFYSALHFLYLHYDDPTRDLWRLANCYNGNNKMMGNGRTVRVNYANSVTGRLRWGWPFKPFSEKSDRDRAKDNPFDENDPDYIEPYKLAEAGLSGTGTGEYILPPADAGGRDSPLELPIPVPDTELEVNTVENRSRRAQVLAWERKWLNETKEKNERLLKDGKITGRFAPPWISLPSWITPLPLDWSEERLRMTAQYANSRVGKGSFKLVGGMSEANGGKEVIADGIFVVDLQTHERMEADSIFEPLGWYDKAAKGENGKMVVNSSVHFLVGRTGEIYLISPLEAMCNVGKENKAHMETRFSVGVVRDRNVPLSPEQEYAIARVSAWLESQSLIQDKKDIVGYDADRVIGLYGRR